MTYRDELIYLATCVRYQADMASIKAQAGDYSGARAAKRRADEARHLITVKRRQARREG